MILARIRAVRISATALAAVLAGLAVPASADVLEVGEDGARWIAGGQVAGQAAQQAGNAQNPADPNAASVQANNRPSTPIAVQAANGAAKVERRLHLNIPPHAVADPSQHSRGIPLQYVAKVQELADRYDLSPSLIEALVWQESRWRANAVSHAGARGLAQLMPGTARDLGVNPDDPMQNLEGGARYLREQLNRFDGNLEKALAAYNAGPGRVQRAGGIPRIRETQNYVTAILGRLSDHSRAPQAAPAAQPQSPDVQQLSALELAPQLAPQLAQHSAPQLTAQPAVSDPSGVVIID
jgi:soluble lytic murein transglycosylase-like protein